MKTLDLIFLRRDNQPLPFLILSGLFVLAGLYLIIASGDLIQIISGVLLIITAAVFLSSKTDLFYNPTNNSIISKKRILTKVFEKSETLPEIHYIAAIKVRTSQNLNVLSISTQLTDLTCNLNFVFKNSKQRFLKLDSGKKEDMIKKAKEIAGKINVQILDNSTGEKKWLQA